MAAGRAAASEGGSLDLLEGIIERISFRSADTGYSVLRLSVPGFREPVTAVGTLGPVSVGESAAFTGAWTQHPAFGRQFKFESYELQRPSTTDAVERYLASGVISGVGPAMAKRLVERFGAEALLVIEHQPRRLREVPGFGEKRIESVRESLSRHRAVQEIALFLQECQVSPALAERLYRTFGDAAVETVRTQPYGLIDRVRGVGFETADRMAQHLGVPTDSPARLAAGLAYTLSHASDDGHVYLPLPQLLARGSRLLDAPIGILESLLPELAETGRVIVELDPEGGADRVFLPPLHHAEVGLVNRLRLLSSAPGRKPFPVERAIAWLERRRDPEDVALSEQQKEALALVMRERVSVITGGPGTGKSTITRALIRLFEAAGRQPLLTSPTGRAARRLSEVTGRTASTLHRALEFDPDLREFRRDVQMPLTADLVVVDEASMLDLLLANSLVKAMAPGTHLVLIGDVDQLPSVGPGSVLRDIIESNKIPVCRLTHVFRQALDSLTVRNAHCVNRGEMPELVHPARRNGADCVYLEVTTAEKALEQLTGLVRLSLPRQGFTVESIQVLAPMNKGPLGVLELNRTLQSVLNPPMEGRTEVSRGDVTFRVGDRVIQLVNDYDRDVFNGDTGRIVGIHQGSVHVAFPLAPSVALPPVGPPIDPSRARIAAERRGGYRTRPGISMVRGGAPHPVELSSSDERTVEYRLGELDELQLAYAITVHKSQGSEFPATVTLIHEAHGPMLQRNLLYTALTRSRQLSVILGTRRALAAAIARQTEGNRFTTLAERLRGGCV